jgi:hypothetical protein
MRSPVPPVPDLFGACQSAATSPRMGLREARAWPLVRAAQEGLMTRTHIAALVVLVVAVPAATAGSFFASSAKPCFIAGASGYRGSRTAPPPAKRITI